MLYMLSWRIVENIREMFLFFDSHIDIFLYVNAITCYRTKVRKKICFDIDKMGDYVLHWYESTNDV